MRRFAAIALLLTLAACAPPQDSATRRMPVFFQEWSANLDQEATDTVNAAASVVKEHPGWPVSVIGFADPEGSPQANRDISQLRAQVVTDALVKAGVPAAQITRSARGATAYVSMSLESRRVEIVVGTP
jgi:outer membrane protein OmpA-like peptidoglycan-associated protein